MVPFKLAARYGLATHHASGAPRYTGHTARASGAQQLAARGIELWKIQIFGRWGSAAFLRYVRSSPLASMTKLASEAAAREPANAQRTQPLRLQADAAQLEEVEPPPTQATYSVGHPYVVNTTPGGKCTESRFPFRFLACLTLIDFMSGCSRTCVFLLQRLVRYQLPSVAKTPRTTKEDKVKRRGEALYSPPKHRKKPRQDGHQLETRATQVSICRR